MLVEATICTKCVLFVWLRQNNLQRKRNMRTREVKRTDAFLGTIRRSSCFPARRVTIDGVKIGKTYCEPPFGVAEYVVRGVRVGEVI